MDVAFLMDRTRSVGKRNFELLRGFLLELSNAMAIGPNATHTGIVLFAKHPTVLNTFDNSEYHNGASVDTLIRGISNSLGRRTFIDRALYAANNRLFTEDGGDRPRFPNSLVVMTDGRTNPRSAPFGPIISSLEVRQITRF